MSWNSTTWFIKASYSIQDSSLGPRLIESCKLGLSFDAEKDDLEKRPGTERRTVPTLGGLGLRLLLVTVGCCFPVDRYSLWTMRRSLLQVRLLRSISEGRQRWEVRAWAAEDRFAEGRMPECRIGSPAPRAG